MLVLYVLLYWFYFESWQHKSTRRTGRDRIVVSTSRCGRDNPGSNPGHGRDDLWLTTTAKPHVLLCLSFVY